MGKKEKKPIGIAGGAVRGAIAAPVGAAVIKVLGVLIGSKK
jgi:hypothetical protein